MTPNSEPQTGFTEPQTAFNFEVQNFVSFQVSSSEFGDFKCWVQVLQSVPGGNLSAIIEMKHGGPT